MKPNRRNKQRKDERNKSLIKDYQGGMPIKDMMDKYHISRQRIHKIITTY